METAFSLDTETLRLISTELKAVNIDISSDIKGLMSLLDKTNENKNFAPLLNTLKDGLLQLLGSEAVSLHVDKLMKAHTIDGKAITPNSFQKQENRKDYLPIAKAVLLHSITPFFEGLV